jgi:hypothetical protein
VDEPRVQLLLSLAVSVKDLKIAREEFSVVFASQVRARVRICDRK